MRSVKKVEKISPTANAKERTPTFMLGSHERQESTFKRMLQQKADLEKSKKKQQTQQTHQTQQKPIIRGPDTLEISEEGRRLYEELRNKKDL